MTRIFIFRVESNLLKSFWWILQSMFKNTKDSGKAILITMGKVVGSHFIEKNFDGMHMNCTDLHTKLMFAIPSLSIGEEWGSIHEHVFGRNYTKCQTLN